jgi:hypothetical protein
MPDSGTIRLEPTDPLRTIALGLRGWKYVSAGVVIEGAVIKVA